MLFGGFLLNNPCVYSVITGNYENLGSYPRFSLDLNYIVFTDNSELRSDKFDIRYIPELSDYSKIVASRLPKILPHLFLPEYSESLYLDNSVSLSKNPRNLLDQLLAEKNIGLLNHSFNQTIFDEFISIAENQKANISDLKSCLFEMRTMNKDYLTQKPIWGGMIARRHNDSLVIEALQMWWDLFKKFPPRDQLVLPLMAVSKSYGSAIHLFNWSNTKTRYHKWPINNSRKKIKEKPNSPQALKEFRDFLQAYPEVIDYRNRKIYGLSYFKKFIRETKNLVKLICKNPKLITNLLVSPRNSVDQLRTIYSRRNTTY